MPEIRVTYEWGDRSWKEELARLPAADQAQLRSSVLSLIEVLKTCTNFILDRDLKAWSPKRWHPHSQVSEFGAWAVYRLGDRENRGRAIVCCVQQDDTIYLVAKTAIHSYDFCTKLIDKFDPGKNPKPRPLKS